MNLQFRPAFACLLGGALLLGLAYPLSVTGLARVFFPRQAEGSLIRQDGRVIGSTLIGQSFIAPRDFWGRPSATLPGPYNASASGASNLAPSSPVLAEAVQARIAALRAGDPEITGPVPVDLITASASGLDPDISPAAAIFQVRRVARARRLDEARVRALVLQHVQPPQFGLLGEARVNVLELNRDLDGLR